MNSINSHNWTLRKLVISEIGHLRKLALPNRSLLKLVISKMVTLENRPLRKPDRGAMWQFSKWPILEVKGFKVTISPSDQSLKWPIFEVFNYPKRSISKWMNFIFKKHLLVSAYHKWGDEGFEVFHSHIELGEFLAVGLGGRSFDGASTHANLKSDFESNHAALLL